MERWHRIVLVAAGLALIAGFFLPWRMYYGYVDYTGYYLTFRSGYAWWIKLAVGAAPIVGMALVGAGVSGDKRARAFALLASLGIVGALGAKAASMLISGTGLGLWLVAGGALVALSAGLAGRKR